MLYSKPIERPSRTPYENQLMVPMIKTARLVENCTYRMKMDTKFQTLKIKYLAVIINNLLDLKRYFKIDSSFFSLNTPFF